MTRAPLTNRQRIDLAAVAMRGDLPTLADADLRFMVQKFTEIRAAANAELARRVNERTEKKA